MSDMLVVVDMQNGFINDNSRHIVSRVKNLIEKSVKIGMPIVFTRFINDPNGGHVKWIGWKRFMSEPEICIVEELVDQARTVIDKSGYSTFVPEFLEIVKKYSVSRLIICGVATDGCVLKTAVDAFERMIEPIVVYDACASHAGQSVHDAGLLLLSRFIGKNQLRTIDQVFK